MVVILTSLHILRVKLVRTGWTTFFRLTELLNFAPQVAELR